MRGLADGEQIAVHFRSRYRVHIVRFVVDAFLIALVVGVMPGLTVRFDNNWIGYGVLAIGYGVLTQFVRPPLNLVLLPFLIQSYGLVLLLVDAILFSILIWIFIEPVEVTNVVSVVVGGALLGILRLGAEGLLGLSSPVVPGLVAGPDGSNTRGALPSYLKIGADRVRLLRIRRVLFRHGLDALFSRGLIGAARRRVQTVIWRPTVPLTELTLPVRFRLLIEELGPTYVKLGQIISSRARSLPDDWLAELEMLQSDAPPVPYEDIERRIVDELGAPPDELFARFDHTPLAAASLAQVHRAQLFDGTEVAVKVQRPQITSKLQSDVKLLVQISKALAGKAGWAKEVDLPGIVAEFGSSLLRELDYSIEAYNARRLNALLAPVEGVRVPEVHYERSSSAVLTLEFIPGAKATDRDAIMAAGLDTEVLADRVIRAAVKMLVFDGFFHADPHPGNVFVDLSSGAVTLLDTGMVGELTALQRVKMIGLAQASHDGDVLGMAQGMKSLSARFKDGDDADYYTDFQRRLSPFLDPPPGHEVDVMGQVLPAGMSVLREAGYRVDPQFTLALKSMTQAQAITEALVPHWSGTEFMNRALAAGEEMAADIVSDDVVIDAGMKQLKFFGRELLQELPSLQGGARSWIDYLKKGGLTVTLDTTGLDQQIGSLRRIAHTATTGVVLAGLLVGSAIAAGIGGLDGSELQPVTGLAVAVFTIASVVSVALVAVGSYRFLRRQG